MVSHLGSVNGKGGGGLLVFEVVRLTTRQIICQNCATSSYLSPLEDVTWHTRTNENAIRYRITNHSLCDVAQSKRRSVGYRTTTVVIGM